MRNDTVSKCYSSKVESNTSSHNSSGHFVVESSNGLHLHPLVGPENVILVEGHPESRAKHKREKQLDGIDTLVGHFLSGNVVGDGAVVTELGLFLGGSLPLAADGDEPDLQERPGHKVAGRRHDAVDTVADDEKNQSKAHGDRANTESPGVASGFTVAAQLPHCRDHKPSHERAHVDSNVEVVIKIIEKDLQFKKEVLASKRGSGALRSNEESRASVISTTGRQISAVPGTKH